MRTYYIQVGSQEYGPYSPEQMREGIADGSITPETQAKTSISGSWQSVGSIFPDAAAIAADPARAVRRSSYGGLRFLINFATFLTIVFIGISVAQLVKEVMAAGEITLYSAHIMAAAHFLLTFLGTLIFRGLALALLDIADAHGK